MTDPRPADLTAQEREALRDIVCAWDDTSPGDDLADDAVEFVRLCLEAVPSLAAPSRGQGASEAMCGGCGHAAGTMHAMFCPPHPGCGFVSPAPVASPEVPETDGSFGSMVPVRQVKLPVPAPAGPETGWLTMSEREMNLYRAIAAGHEGEDPPQEDDIEALVNECDAQRRRAEEAERELAAERKTGDEVGAIYFGTDGMDVMWQARERRRLEAALSAATERAEKAEREADEQEAALDALNTWQARECRRLEAERAAALKLAGEFLDEWIDWHPGDEDAPGFAALRDRLASLSSPSAPESGNTEGTDAAP